LPRPADDHRRRAAAQGFLAGSDAVAGAEQHIAKLQQETDAFRDLSCSLALDEAATMAS
jgi:hypothetical protein